VSRGIVNLIYGGGGRGKGKVTKLSIGNVDWHKDGNQKVPA